MSRVLIDFHCTSFVSWSESVEKALQTIEQRGDGDVTPMSAVLQVMEATLNVLADSVLHEQPPVRRKKLEHLVNFSLKFIKVEYVLCEIREVHILFMPNTFLSVTSKKLIY